MAGLDLLRFAAAVMVMLFHFGYASSIPGTEQARLLSNLYPELDWLSFGWVGVQIFFVISGIVISYSAEQSTAARFARARALRLLPAAWLCAPLSAIAVVAYGLKPDDHLWLNLAKSMLLYPRGPWIDDVYWTLSVEIMFYAAVWWCLIWGSSLRLLAYWLGLSSALFWIVGIVLAPDFVLATTWHWGLQLSLVHHGVFFALGILIYQSRQQALPILLTLILVGAGVVQIAALALYSTREFGVPMSGAVPSFVWAVAVAAAYCAVHLPIKSTVLLTFIGLSTYPLYLLHNYIGLALMRYMVDCGLDRWGVLIWTIEIVIPLSAWIVRVELPLRRRLERIVATVQ